MVSTSLSSPFFVDIEQHQITTTPNSTTFRPHNDAQSKTTTTTTRSADAAPMSVLTYPRCMWTISAVVALLSARRLLVEHNFHYPLLLYCAQICVGTCAVVIHALSRWRSRREIHSGKSEASERQHTRCGRLLVAATLALTALSLLCLLQAILHFYNLPTLVMLTTIAYFTEDTIMLLVGMAPHSRAEVFRILALLMACVGILVSEYRLAVQGLIASISAMLFAGAARALRRITKAHYPADIPDKNTELQQLVVAGYLVAAGWVLCFWSEARVITANLNILPLLVVTALSSAFAILIGRGIILPTISDMDDEYRSRQTTLSPSVRDAFSLLALTGIVGISSTLTIRRSYTTWPQCVCFALAIAYISMRAKVEMLHRYDLENCSYELLEGEQLPLVTENDTEDDTEELASDSAANSSRSISAWWNALEYRSLIALAALILLWIAFAALNFSTPDTGRKISSLDLDYEPPFATEVVISMYKEPVEDVAKLISGLKIKPNTVRAFFTIYIKDDEANTEQIQNETGADAVIKRPNVGREGETFLYHIVDKWNELATHTIFLQAGIHNPREFSWRVDYFDPSQTGFLNLGWVGACDCESCGDRHSWQDHIGLIPRLHYQVSNSTTCGTIQLSYKGQFIASARRIRGINKTIYHDLWQAFVNETSWAHQPEFLRGRQDSMGAPDFGYTMERLWPLLLQCSDMDTAWQCPTILSGWRVGGSTADCQCFDSDP